MTLREALMVYPENAAARHALGLSLVRQRQMLDAVPELAKAGQLRPDMTRYAYVYGVALHEAGEGQRALQILTEAHEWYPAEREILVALAEYAREAGDRQAAIAWARKLIALSPEDSQALQLLEGLERSP